MIDISDGQYRSFSRIIPKNDHLDKWLSYTRIGKIAWFWSEINTSIHASFNKIKNVEKYYVKLEDINQNYDFYEKLSKKFNFKNIMTKKNFYNVINKAPNHDIGAIYEYKLWNNVEKKEFDEIINNNFPNYDKINTNL